MINVNVLHSRIFKLGTVQMPRGDADIPEATGRAGTQPPDSQRCIETLLRDGARCRIMQNAWRRQLPPR